MDGVNPNRILVEVSARHVHLSRRDIDILFGPGYQLTKFKDLSQPGQYAAVEKITIVNGEKSFENLRILGPERPDTQVELSLTDCFEIGLKAPIRLSGDLKGTPGIKMIGPQGEVNLDKGVIVAARHMHCTKEEADALKLEHNDEISIKVDGERETIYDHIVVRVDPSFKLVVHLDTDEGNAGQISGSTFGSLIKVTGKHIETNKINKMAKINSTKSKKNNITCDGNTAAANIAYAFSEVAAIYPITPASPMGELAEVLSAKNKENLFGVPVKIQEMQSEAGAAGTVHGSLSAGALTTTFTASQGLLLMLPNMYKIAGEMLPTVFHIAARSLAAQALSIYGDHSDVMAARGTGFAMISSSNVQEAQDLAVISHLSTMDTKVPFLHFFDGFRTSHELQKIEGIDYETLKSMINWDSIKEFKDSGLKPQKPYAKVGAQGPEVYFQGRETVNKYYDATPGIVKKYMDLFYEKTGRRYELFEYVGNPNADKIIIAMGSGTDTIDETVEYLNNNGENVGILKVKLYRPFSVIDFLNKIPKTVKKIAVLDRTKEPGSIGEPLYLDVIAALRVKKEFNDVSVIGGRYGLSSKEFTPSMIKGVFDHLENNGFHGFTVGINDDVTHLSIPYGENINTDVNSFQVKFWGYGSDGTVSASKNTLKIIGDNTQSFVQINFDYDAKKSGGVTRSYVRISDKPIKSTYMPTNPDVVVLSKPSYIGRYDILKGIKEGGIFLLNTTYSNEEAFNSLTYQMQKTIIEKKINFFVIDAFKISKQAGLGNVISTVMQTAFFKITNLLPIEKSINLIKEFIDHQFNSIGHDIVEKNWKCVDGAIDNVFKVEIPSNISDIKLSANNIKLIPDNATDFAKYIILPSMKFEGDSIPVSRMSLNGAVPTGTTKLEKREVTLSVPKWDASKCIQCGQCVMVCPNSSIRMKQIKKEDLKNAPQGFNTLNSISKNDEDLQFRIQCYPQDCVGCTLCVKTCPMNCLEMVPIQQAIDEGEIQKAEFFDNLPDNTTGININTIKGLQFKSPLIEFPGSCPGCGEVSYVKTLTQLFGDNMLVANATGCSSIWGGTFPTIPYTTNKDGCGPAWANSLFEDNAEYGLGFKLAVEANRDLLKSYIEKLLKTGTTQELKSALEKLLSVWNKTDEEAKLAVREVEKQLPIALDCVYGESAPILKRIDELKDHLINKQVWIIGGDGWAYDIGYGGLDHVMAQGKKVNVLVLDTEVYSNTGGQASKATPIGAIAKFAAKGKETAKKNLGLMMMTYGNVYVASVSLGANKQQLINALVEAEKYDGPSIIIAYSPCIAHGCDMNNSIDVQKKAVESGYWPLYRYNPALRKEGKSPLIWDGPEVKDFFKDFIRGETRYKAVEIENPKRAEDLFEKAKQDALRRIDDIKREGTIEEKKN